MAFSNTSNTVIVPFTAGGTIAINRVVVLDTTAGQVLAASAIAGVAIGVAIGPAVAGEGVAVQVNGIAKITASAAITLGAEVMATASGAGKVSTASGATARAIGVALETVANDGEVVSVLLRCPAVTGPATA
jgi:hypothetical protein